MPLYPRYTEIPFLRSKLKDFLGNRDEIMELTLLKAIAQPTYIIACYVVAMEGRDAGTGWNWPDGLLQELFDSKN